MNKILLFSTLLGLSMACVCLRQLSQVKGELATARETVKTIEQQRVPKEELVRVKAEVAEQQDKMAALGKELADTRDRLTASEESVKAAQRHLNLLRDNTPETGSSSGLVKGTYTLLDDTLVYSADAQLKIGKSVLVSSPTGLMLSDKEVATVAGDLAVETPSGTLQATHAFIDVSDGKIEMTGDSVTFTNK